MRPLVLALFLLLPTASAAQAERGWLVPQPATIYPSSSGDAAVSGDGTVITAAAGSSYTEVRAGPVVRFLRGAKHVRVAAGGLRELVVAWDDGERVLAMAAREDAFGAPVLVGSGQLADLAANRQGDVVALINGRSGVETALRPAGGSFGAATRVAGVDPVATVDPSLTSFGFGNPFAAAVDREGDVTVIRARERVIAVTVARGGEVGPVAELAPARAAPSPAPPGGERVPYLNPQLVVDAHDRAAAFWGSASAGVFRHDLVGAVRGADGAWTAVPAAAGGSAGTSFSLGADDAGNLVLAYVEDRLRIAFGSLAGDPAPPPVEPAFTGNPVVTTAADGTTVVAASDNVTVRAVRRDGLGAFGAPVDVACGLGPAVGGFDAAGNAVVGLLGEGGRPWVTVRDTDGPDATAPACSGGYFPQLPFSSTPAIPHPRERTQLTAAIHPFVSVDIAAVDWDLDDEPGFDRRSEGPTLEHVFPALGQRTFHARVHVRNADGTTSEHVGAVSLYVGPRVTLRILPRRRRGVLRRGLPVRLSTTTPEAVGTSVYVSTPAGFGTWARRIVLTAAPRRTNLRLPKALRRQLRGKRPVTLAFRVTPGDQSAPSRASSPPTLATADVTLRR